MNKAPRSRRTTSPAGIDLIKASESFSFRRYICPAAQPTIGWGHVITAADDLGATITEDQGETLLRSDLAVVEIYLTAVFPGLTQPQFDALASFCFNVGLGNFEDSTLFKRLKAGDFAAAAEEFPKWNKATDPATGRKVILPGLVKRRAAERALFLTPETH